MTDVMIDKQKIDLLANAISVKSGEPVTMTLDEMVEAVDGIEPDLQNKTVVLSSAKQVIEPDSGYDGLSSVTTLVPLQSKAYSVTSSGYTAITPDSGIVGLSQVGVSVGAATIPTTTGNSPSGTQRTVISASTSTRYINLKKGYFDTNYYYKLNAMPSMTLPSAASSTSSGTSKATITPTTSAQYLNIPTGYNGTTQYYTVAAMPIANLDVTYTRGFVTQNNERKWRVKGTVIVADGDDGYVYSDDYNGEWDYFNAVPTGTTITPSTSSQTVGGANYMMEDAVTVAAMPSGSVSASATKGTVNNHAISVTPTATVGTAGYLAAGSTNGTAVSVSASELVSGTVAISASGNTDVTNYATASVAAGSATASATKGSVSNHSISITPSVTRTAGWVTAGSANGTAVSVSASELVSGTYAVDSSGTKDVTNYASASVPAGTAGTPSASKGTVSNHSVSVTPSVTNSTGWITGSTKTGTAVTVSASELVSGSETKTVNGTYDVTNLAELVVDVSGGGTSSVQVGTKTTTLSAEASSISFTGLSGNPSSFVITSQSDVATNTDGVTAVVYDGTSLHGQTMTTQVEADTGFTKSYSSGTLTITATTAQFQANAYKLAYTYDGSSSDIHTSDVQVGSGATSITFSSLSGRPMYWSCIFKSNFSTSSGYQRVICVANDGSSIYGLDMDSSAHAATAWTATYSGGNLTISSGGTNNGGYFHQPGYYQLTYAVDDSAPQYQAKSAYATTTAQTITPDSGYDALESVSIGAVSQTNLTAANIKNGTTISISNGQSNLWSVTGTYTGGGGGGSASIDSTTWTNSTNTTTSHTFSNLSGTPKAAFLRCTSSLSRSSSSTNYFIADMVWDGESCKGNSYRRSNGNYANVTSGYSVTTGSNSITFTSSGTSTTNPGSFYNGTYELTYVY